MKHRSLLLTLATATALTGTSAAMAGAAEGSWYAAPQAVYVHTDKEYEADNAFGGGLAVGKVLNKDWDVELGFVDSRHSVSGGGNKLKLSGPTVGINRVFMRDSSVTPFIGVGANYMSSRKNGTGKTERGVGAIVKAGLLADLTTDGALQFALEVGERFDNFSDNLNDTLVGIGLHLNFGGSHPVAAAAPVAMAAAMPAPAPMAPPPPADSDHDGVLDSADRCPNTPAGAVVDATGCELDSDHDGVVDRLDKCPRTPMGDKVDAVGCGLSIALQVQFDTAKATIKPESNAELDDFVRFMKEVPSAKGVLEGHTDSVGKDAYNLSLSQHRADAVKAFVVSKGVDASRIVAKGFGETKAIADNKTDEGRAANRRVVFVRSDVTN